MRLAPVLDLDLEVRVLLADPGAERRSGPEPRHR